MHKSWQERHTWSPSPLPSSSLVFFPSPFKPYIPKTHSDLGLKTTRGEYLTKSFTIQSLYEALDLGLKTTRGDYLSSEKSEFLHYLITLSGAWLTDICSQASHDKPLSITGATTRCCRRGYRRCLCWRDVEASPSHIAKETLQIEIKESKAEAAVTPKR